MVEWTKQQEAALVKAREWLARPRGSGQQSFRLHGAAGTGKSSCANDLAAGIKNVIFAAPTGKAAARLRDLGCPTARTIHKLIYLRPDSEEADRMQAEILRLQDELTENAEFEEDPAVWREREERLAALRTALRRIGRGLKFELNPASDARWADLIVVDEASMVGEHLAEHMLSFGTRVLALGDPFQLPPVKEQDGPFMRGTPDVLLTEVHRQALDSPILSAATALRNGGDYREHGDGKHLRLVENLDELDLDHLSQTQVICGLNVTRNWLNQQIRAHRGVTSQWPVVGDRVICRKNDYDLGHMNGDIFDVVEVWNDPFTKNPERSRTIELVVSDPITGRTDTVNCLRSRFLGGTEFDKHLSSFEYGFAITVHLSQGSQWDDLVWFDEAHRFGGTPRDRMRHRYTSVTRAAKRLTIFCRRGWKPPL